ncbi:MAG: hypothetical protein H7333_00530, partial [Bdellovibrionales bacterium]|nr:hypothetical protein [Oligoflexia bacterium]
MTFRKFAEFLDRHAASVSAFFAILTIIASFYVVKLYANLKPDLEELLPTHSRSVKDLKEVTSRLRAIDNLAVLLFSSDAKALGKFQEVLAQDLQKLPPEVSAGVEYKISEELTFFKKRKSLFISTKDLSDIRHYVGSRIAYEKFLFNPLNLVIEDKPVEPRYDFKGLESRYASRADEFSHFPGGVYATPDGTKRLILIYAPNQSIATAHRLKDAVQKTIENLKPSTYAADLKVLYSGNSQDIIEEQAALLKDLTLSTLLVALLVTLALWVYYRSVFATFALIASL